MYWVHHVVPKRHHSSAARALEAFLNDEADYLAEIVHISPQFRDEASPLFGEPDAPPEPIAFVVVLKTTEGEAQAESAAPEGRRTAPSAR